jgi:fructokinase
VYYVHEFGVRQLFLRLPRGKFVSDGPIVVWGEVLWDRFVSGDTLGGAPANVAWHLGMAGQWSVLATRVGNDVWGRRAIEELARYVDTALVQVDATRATGEVNVHVIDGEPRYQLVPNRAWEHIECDDEVIAALADASAFIYGTLSQRTGPGLAQWQKAVAAAPPGCIKVCDPNLRGNMLQMSEHEKSALAAALAAADIIKINDREHDALKQLFGWRDPIAALRQQRDCMIVVTHGDRGSTIYPAPTNDDGMSAVEIAAVPPLERAADADNVGCGDAYVAVLVHGLLSGWDLPASASAASKWAGVVAGRSGATPIFDDELIASIIGDVGWVS